MTHMIPDDRYPNGHSDDAGSLDPSGRETFGEQEQRIYVELSNSRLATLGLDVQTVSEALARQNAVAPSGYVETRDERIYLRPSGAYDTVEAIRETRIRAGGRELRIGDIARVARGFVEPPAPRFRFRGQDALGLGVSMAKGGDIIALGRNLKAAIARIQAQLPVGMELTEVASQPDSVRRSIDEFVWSLAEAVVIVLVESHSGTELPLSRYQAMPASASQAWRRRNSSVPGRNATTSVTSTPT